MKNNFNPETGFVTFKPKAYLVICSLALAVTFGSCNNKGTGDTTTHNDTSSAVSGKVDTTGSATKQP